MPKNDITAKAIEHEDRLRKVQRLKELIAKDEYDVEARFEAAFDVLIRNIGS